MQSNGISLLFKNQCFTPNGKLFIMKILFCYSTYFFNKWTHHDYNL